MEGRLSIIKAGIKLWITSLNSHFSSRKDSTTCGGRSEMAGVEIKVCNSHSE
jgi:hypothetical protein